MHSTVNTEYFSLWTAHSSSVHLMNWTILCTIYKLQITFYKAYELILHELTYKKYFPLTVLQTVQKSCTVCKMSDFTNSTWQIHWWS